MEELISRLVLDDDEKKSIDFLDNQPLKQVTKLLDIMIEQADYKKYKYFLLSMMETNQGHLRNYMLQDGGEDKDHQ